MQVTQEELAVVPSPSSGARAQGFGLEKEADTQTAPDASRGNRLHLQWRGKCHV